LCSEPYPEFIPLKNINEFMLHLNGLALKCKNIHDLNLSAGLEELAEKLVECVEYFPKLEKFSLYSWFGMKSISGFSFGGFKRCANLKVLQLNGIKTKDKSFEGMEKFAHNLKKLEYYSDSKFTDEFVGEIEEIISSNARSF
jgi:hypothetical protein